METNPDKLREEVLKMPKHSWKEAMADHDQPYEGNEKRTERPKDLRSLDGPEKTTSSSMETSPQSTQNASPARLPMPGEMREIISMQPWRSSKDAEKEADERRNRKRPSSSGRNPNES